MLKRMEIVNLAVSRDLDVLFSFFLTIYVVVNMRKKRFENTSTKVLLYIQGYKLRLVWLRLPFRK